MAKKLNMDTILNGRRKSEIAMLSAMGAEWATEWIKKHFSRQERFIYELIKNSRYVTKESGIVISPVHDRTYIIHTLTGSSWNYRNDEYETGLSGNSLNLKKSKSDNWECVVYKGKSDFKGIKLYRARTTGGNGNYIKTIIKDSVLGTFKIMEHFIHAAIKFGYRVLDAMGVFAELDVHHGDLNRWNNAAYNLFLLTHEDHMEIHRELRRQFAK